MLTIIDHLPNTPEDGVASTIYRALCQHVTSCSAIYLRLDRTVHHLLLYATIDIVRGTACIVGTGGGVHCSGYAPRKFMEGMEI